LKATQAHQAATRPQFNSNLSNYTIAYCHNRCADRQSHARDQLANLR
jgi:hypothetical protein